MGLIGLSSAGPSHRRASHLVGSPSAQTTAGPAWSRQEWASVVGTASTAGCLAKRIWQKNPGDRLRRYSQSQRQSRRESIHKTALCSKASEDGEPPATWSLDSSRVQLLALLALIFTGNQACRALPFYLVDFDAGALPEYAMNAALGFSSAEYGFYATLGFTVPFTAASVVAGALADSSDRVRIIGLAGLLWSALTISMAFAPTYDVLLGERSLMALAQAVINPGALSLIADLFPDARATANAIFGLGIYVGGGLASLGAALDESVGWQGTCTIFGLASLGCSALAFGAVDPRTSTASPQNPRSPTDPTSSTPSALSDNKPAGFASSSWSDFDSLLEKTLGAVSSSSARWLLLASFFRFSAGFAILVWLPPVIRSRFPGEVESFAVYNSLIKAVAGGTSSLLGGVAADSLRARGLGDRAGAVFSAASSLLAAPLWFMVLSSDLQFEACMGFLLVEYLVAEGWLGPAVASLQTAVPPDRRGAAQGIFSALTALGNGLPAALGLLSGEDLATGFQFGVCACYIASAACFVGAAISLPSAASGSESS